MEPISIRIGGVPEHFNLPWHLAMEEGHFRDAGIHLNWEEYCGGTGAMAKDLRENNLDMALLLTEGAIADIITGGNYHIAGLFVKSPLIWGIHVHKEAAFQQVNELEGKTFGISRYGSGSHLMAVVNAQSQGWAPDQLRFELVGNLDGAREALANGTADAFMWEKFTTKPLVDNGEWRRIGECPTPWPCFVAVVRDEFAKDQPQAVQQVLKIARESSQRLKQRSDAVELLAHYYHLKEEDIKVWLGKVEWATEPGIEKGVLQQVMDTLYELDIIDQKVKPEKLCHSFCQLR